MSKKTPDTTAGGYDAMTGPAEMKTRIVIQSASRLTREMFASLLASWRQFTVVGQASSLEALHSLCLAQRPDSVLVDGGRVDEGLVKSVREFRRAFPTVGVVVAYQELTGPAARVAARSDLGTMIPSSAGIQSLARALRRYEGGVVRQGHDRRGLTDRELAVISLLSTGHSAAEIATTLGISPLTVENHKRHIYAKLGVGSQSQAVTRSAALGLLGRLDGTILRQTAAATTALAGPTTHDGAGPAPALDGTGPAATLDGAGPAATLDGAGPAATLDGAGKADVLAATDPEPGPPRAPAELVEELLTVQRPEGRIEELPLAVVHGRPGPGLERVVLALAGAELAFVLTDRLPGLDGEAWVTHQPGPVVVVLIDPTAESWLAPSSLGAPAVVVYSSPTHDIAATVDALLRGACALLSVDDVPTHLRRALPLAANGCLTIGPAYREELVRWLSLGPPARTSGNILLTNREREILVSIARGDTVRQTARMLGIAVKTVENTQTRLFRKLGARNRSETLSRAYRLGLLDPGGNGQRAN